MRKKIHDSIKPLYPTYSIGQHQGLCTSPYVIIKFNNQIKSIGVTSGGWQIFEVMLYIPHKSIATIDNGVASIISALKEDFEFTGDITPDFYDSEKEAFMKSIKFKIPKEVL